VSPTNETPTIATPATASSPIISGKTVGLSFLADDDGGEAFLKYTWVCTAKPAGATPTPTFSVNGINAAKNTVARFYRAGVYTFTAYAKDAGGRYVASGSVTVKVKQTFKSVLVSPNTITLAGGATQQFTAMAMDQFNRALAVQPPVTWSRTGVGSITSTGLYSAPLSEGGDATAWATVAGVKGAASIITEPSDVPDGGGVVDDNPSPQPSPSPSVVGIPTLPAPTGTVVNVSTVSQLQNAVANLQSGTTIMIAPGTYNLTGSLMVPQNRTNVAIRGATGNRDDVVIRGNGMTGGSVPFGIWTGNVNGVTIADLTIRDVTDHGIILNAGTESPLIHNVRLLDIGDQMIKSNPDGALGGVDNGILEYSVMEYSSGWAPDYYVAGLDLHTGDNWLIQHNTFKDFRQQSATTDTHPALLIWNDSRNARVEGNSFINNDRDISLGLEGASRNNPSVPDQQGGLIENNMISRDTVTHGDVAIFVAGPNTKVYHNTYYDESGFYPYAIEYRFASTTGVDIRNNLLNRAIRARDGATGTVANNLTTAQASWFVNPGTGDLHLKSTATQAIDQVAALFALDYDSQSRPTVGTSADYGADEYVP
jgi:hypothetical protein